MPNAVLFANYLYANQLLCDFHFQMQWSQF